MSGDEQVANKLKQRKQTAENRRKRNNDVQEVEKISNVLDIYYMANLEEI